MPSNFQPQPENGGGTSEVELGPASRAALEETTVTVANDPAVNKFASGTRITRVFTISTLGDNIIIVPAAGKRVRAYWIGYSTSELNTAEVLALLRFGSGSNLYGWYLGAPGAFSHWEPITGEVGEALIVNLSSAQPVQVNVTYEEV